MMQKNQIIVSLITGGSSGQARDFAKAASCSEEHARRTLKWLVWKGIAQMEHGRFQRFVYSL